MRRRDLLSLAAFPAVHTARAAARPKTNVVLVMTDDHGGWATGYNGCADTPTIDGLSRNGVTFTNAFAATPVCSPSRMTYITGKMPSTHGVQDWLQPVDSFGPLSSRFLDGHLTWTECFARAGYTMGMCGKWHMGHDDIAQAGFSWWATVPGGGGTYRDPEFVRNGKREKLTGFKTDLVADSALEFLGTVRDKPFVLMMPTYAPHTPFDYVPDAYTKPYEGSAFPCFPDEPKHPDQNPGLAAHHGNAKSKRAYSGLISGVDANLARVLKRLDEIGARENTLIVFTADQGWNAGHHGVWGKGNGTWPFNMYEQSIRVPMVWNHPAAIRRASKVDAMISSYDLFPTLLDYCGIPAPAADPKRVGRSYADFVRGRAPRRWRDRLFFEYEYTRAVRTQTLKYVQRATGMPSGLFDLAADPGEKTPLASDARSEALRREIEAFFARIGAPPIDQWQTTTKQRLPQYSTKPRA